MLIKVCNELVLVPVFFSLTPRVDFWLELALNVKFAVASRLEFLFVDLLTQVFDAVEMFVVGLPKTRSHIVKLQLAQGVRLFSFFYVVLADKGALGNCLLFYELVESLGEILYWLLINREGELLALRLFFFFVTA